MIMAESDCFGQIDSRQNLISGLGSTEMNFLDVDLTGRRCRVAQSY